LRTGIYRRSFVSSERQVRRINMEEAMSVSVKSNDLRTRLNSLDQIVVRDGESARARPIAAKVFEGDDAVFGSRS